MVSFRKGLRPSLFIASILFVAAGSTAYSQQVFGSIIGTVTDPSGSAVANAKVTITDVTKSTSSEVTTNESGAYSKGQLIPDQYKVTIEAAGFQKTASNELTVQVDQATQFNAALQVGSVDQTVEVTAAAPLLQTDRADVAQTFTSKEISQLPSIGRNLQAFELLNPGTVSLGWQHASDEDPQGSVQTVVNGQLFDSTGYYLDGTINQDPILGIIVINPTFDSVNEVKQANQDYDAEYGYTSAGVMTYSTKSGTNAFHGDAFEYLYLNTPGFQDFGRNPFSENTSAGVPTTHQSQFGGSIGGKIIKDKLFFFGDAQLTRNLQGGSLLTTVPTLQERGIGQPGGQANFGDWLAIQTGSANYTVYDPTTGNQTTGVGRTAFPGNIIPANRLSPQALALLNYFPLPNTVGSTVNGVAAPYNNYENSGTLTKNGEQWNTRWDYYGNEKNTFFGRYSYATFSEQAPGVFGEEAGGQAFNNANYAGSSQAFNESIAGGWTHTANPTLINEFRFGYMRYHVTDVPNGYGTQPANAIGIPGLNLDNTYTSGLPYFEIDNPVTTTSLGYALGNNTHCNCPLDQLERQYQFVDNISKVHGNHTFKFGADVRYALNLRVPSDNHRAGQLYFNNSTTAEIPSLGAGTQGGIAMAGFLLGDVSTFNRYVSTSTDAQERQKRLFWYAQDEWRINPKLTLTYGLRWEWVFPETVNDAGNGAELNVNTGQMDVFGVGLVSDHGYQNMNWHNFAPRIGLAYQITPKTVVRAGYGWSYSLGTFGNNFGHNVTQNPPVLLNQTLSQSNAAGGCPTNFCDVFNLAQGPPAANLTGYLPGPDGTYKWPGTSVSAFTRPGTLTMPVVYAYNFTVQRQVTNRVSVSGGYVGNSGRHAILGTDENINLNTQLFVPGSSSSNASLYPFNGLLGARYNYGWTSGVNDFCNCANNQYNSFQALFTVKGLGGYTLQGNYTYQVVQGDGYGSSEQYTFLYDRALGYGNNPNMPHNQVVLAQTFDIPFGKGRKFGSNSNKVVDLVLGGWQLSGITTYYSGFPFMPSIENYGSGTQPYTGPNNRPDVGTGSPYSSTQNRNQWIVGLGSGAFTLPASNTFGNYPINTLIGPRFINQDASLMKVFSLTERFKFMLRVDTTNTFNHTNLGLPNADIQSGSVGQITGTAFGGTYNMRRIQYSGTINF